MCLESGSYFLNFVKCAECDRKDTLMIQNRIQNEDEDGEELVTFQRKFNLLTPIRNISVR